MQNKGFVIFISAALAVICLFYLSFTPVVNHYDKKAQQITEMGGNGKAYLDSMANEKVWFGSTLKKARTQQIGLGLDLKGGMNVVLRVNATDLLRNLSGGYDDPNFLQALKNAEKSARSGDFVDKFVAEYRTLSPEGKLTTIFSNGALKEDISARTTDAEVMKILKQKYNSASEAAINVLRSRIDRFGVVSPNIQKIEGEGRILVELPGVTEPDRVRDLLQRSANLQFWRTYTGQEVLADLQMANDKLTALAKADQAPTQVEETATTTEEETAEKVDQETTAEVAKQDSTGEEKEVTTAASEQPNGHGVLFELLTPTGYNSGAVAGIARAADKDKIDSLLEIAYANGYMREDLRLLWANNPIEDPQTKKQTDRYELYAIRYSRDGAPDLTGDVVTTSRSEVNQGGIGNRGPVVTMSMNDEGSRAWARLTKDNIGRAIAIVLDNVVYSAPNVNTEITGGRSEISGNFTVEQTVDLANVLNSGKMDATITIEQENVVGPSLGQDSIRAGIISFIIAIVLLMIYMIIIYGWIPGLIADGALIVNAFFTLGILASFHSVLTLSGIAGLVLTLGMAVDANVLIFERIKEELKSGKSMTRAIHDGYSNAFSAIFDSNLTTIITGIILYAFGTGPIRGFATTLIIGLVASFITAVFLTRVVVEALDKKGRMNKVTYTTSVSKNFLSNPKFNILGRWKFGLGLPIVIIILAGIGLGVWGFNKGIEFSGGRNYIVAFDQPVSIADVRSTLSEPFENKISVTSIGTDGTQIRIATNYKIEENTAEAEDLINDLLYENCAKLFKTAPDKDTFLSQSIVSSQKVSATMSKSITNKAIISVIIALIFMALYILLRFRYLHYSIGAFASVFNTTLSIIALYILLWKIMPFTMELDQNFIAAILAIIGYSINDVVVVFDRVRESMKLYPNRDRYTVMNDALNSTLSRTFNTTISTFIVVLIIFLFGGASMRSFTFAILIGVIIGVYSTLFVASPIAYLVANKSDKRKEAKQLNTARR